MQNTEYLSRAPPRAAHAQNHSGHQCSRIDGLSLFVVGCFARYEFVNEARGSQTMIKKIDGGWMYNFQLVSKDGVKHSLSGRITDEQIKQVLTALAWFLALVLWNYFQLATGNR